MKARECSRHGQYDDSDHKSDNNGDHKMGRLISGRHFAPDPDECHRNKDTSLCGGEQ